MVIDLKTWKSSTSKSNHYTNNWREKAHIDDGGKNHMASDKMVGL